MRVEKINRRLKKIAIQRRNLAFFLKKKRQNQKDEDNKLLMRPKMLP